MFVLCGSFCGTTCVFSVLFWSVGYGKSKLFYMSSALVKVMFFVVLFMVCRICLVLSFLIMAKMSSTHLFLSPMSVLLVTDCDSSCCMTVSSNLCA